MAINQIAEEKMRISVVIEILEDKLDLLRVRNANLPPSEYDDVQLEILPLIIDASEIRRLKTLIENVRRSTSAGESSYMLRIIIRRLRKTLGAKA